MCDYNITFKRIDNVVKEGQNIILLNKIAKLVPINILIFVLKKLGGPIASLVHV